MVMELLLYTLAKNMRGSPGKSGHNTFLTTHMFPMSRGAKMHREALLKKSPMLGDV